MLNEMSFNKPQLKEAKEAEVDGIAHACNHMLEADAEDCEF